MIGNSLTHEVRSPTSCMPAFAEIALIECRIVGNDFYELQDDHIKNGPIGLERINELIKKLGVKFEQMNFPKSQTQESDLLRSTSKEIDEKKPVIIFLFSTKVYPILDHHAHIIHGIEEGKYVAASKYIGNTDFISMPHEEVIKKIRESPKGIDIWVLRTI